MEVWKLLAALSLSVAAMPFVVSSVAADECNPYPVGFCGTIDREMVNFCYRTVGARMVDATDRHVVALGTSEGVALPENNAKGLLYVRLTPSETFVEDPYESDLPFDTLVMETNTIRGVQLAPFRCAMFQWWAECDSWMGPYNIQPAGQNAFPIDLVVA